MDESLQIRRCNVAVAIAFRPTGSAVDSGKYLDVSNPWGIGVPPDSDHVHRAPLELPVYADLRVRCPERMGVRGYVACIVENVI
jgi:hypothetical protein